MNPQIEELNRLSIREFPGYFASLSPPDSDILRGFFKGDFVGPAWLRSLAGPLLLITGLGGWWGKEFDTEGGAINLVWRKGKFSYRFPMRLSRQDSYIDQRSGLALRYAASNPYPWPWIVDELRSIRSDLVLGMTVATLGPLKRLPLPFILQPREGLDGL
ncbi:MAG: hypothetical protein JSW42_03640 [Chloroflexota bacterium]|nr:MAG: hypothetical protein JSW42_03640 [Chloroflexota bacterium]